MVDFTILLLWGAMNPPLPAYVLAGCAVLLAYMALRIGLVSLARQGQQTSSASACGSSRNTSG
jgi:hypothetical protein